jgi:hypothetical protein
MRRWTASHIRLDERRTANAARSISRTGYRGSYLVQVVRSRRAEGLRSWRSAGGADQLALRQLRIATGRNHRGRLATCEGAALGSHVAHMPTDLTTVRKRLNQPAKGTTKLYCLPLTGRGDLQSAAVSLSGSLSNEWGPPHRIDSTTTAAVMDVLRKRKDTCCPTFKPTPATSRKN